MATGAVSSPTSDFYLNDGNNGGTTAFNDRSVFAPDLNDGVVHTDDLHISGNAQIRPWYSGNLGGVPASIALNTPQTVMTYNTLDDGRFNVVSPLDWSVSYDDGNVNLALQSNLVKFENLAGNKNAKSVAALADNFVNGHQTDPNAFQIGDVPSNGMFDQNTLTNLLTGYDDAGFSDIFDEISQFGEAFSHQNAQAYWGVQSFLSSINANINNGADATGNAPQKFALNMNSDSKSTFQLASLDRAMAPSQYHLHAANSNDPYADNQGIWASYNGVRQHTDADGGIGSSAWRSSTDGVVIGYTNTGSTFNWGVAAGHQRSRMNFSDIDSNGKQDGNNLGAYGTWHRSGLYLTGIVGYGRYDNDTYTNGAYGDASSTIKTLSGSLELGKRFARGNNDLTPYASIAWTRINQDDFRIHNGGSGLHLDDTSNHIFTTEIGARYNHRMIDGDGTLKGGWQAGLAWLHQGGDRDLASSVGFSGIAGDASVQGTPLAGSSLVASIGAYGRIHNRLIGYAGYRGTFGSDQKVHGINAGLGYKF